MVVKIMVEMEVVLLIVVVIGSLPAFYHSL